MTRESSQPGVESQQVSRVESTTSDVIRAVTWHSLCGTNNTIQQTVRHKTDDIIDENDGLTLMLDNFCWIGK